MSIGIVHDWFPVIGGGERVVEQLVKTFPDLTCPLMVPRSLREFAGAIRIE